MPAPFLLILQLLAACHVRLVAGIIHWFCQIQNNHELVTPFLFPAVTLILSPPHVALVEIVHNSASGCGASVIQMTQTLCIPLCFRDLFLQSHCALVDGL